MAFQNYLEAANITGAVAPYVYSDASSTKVLTLERLYGSPLTDLEAIKKVTGAGTSTADSNIGIGYSVRDPEEILITALNTWFGSVIACESFHADVHAGNLLVRKPSFSCPFMKLSSLSFDTSISLNAWLAVYPSRWCSVTAASVSSILVSLGAFRLEYGAPCKYFSRLQLHETMI